MITNSINQPILCKNLKSRLAPHRRLLQTENKHKGSKGVVAAITPHIVDSARVTHTGMYSQPLPISQEIQRAQSR